MLTAGGADEQVADSGPGGHSIFTWTLLQGLDGRADLNGDGVITASELAAYVAPAVSQLSRQTPAFGSLVGSEGGEFVFSLGRDAELLSDVSAQLDQKAIALNAELERVRKAISEKQAKNEQLERELAAAKVRLARVDSTGARAAPADDARRRSDQGMRLYREKRYREALAEFEAAAKLAPDDVQVVNNVGFVHYKLGEYRASLEWLQKAVALDPNRGVAYLNLGDTLAELGRKQEAVSAWERYLALVPGSPLAAKVREKIAAAR
jgi:tetratricopeptide (TPR) repeat protein